VHGERAAVGGVSSALDQVGLLARRIKPVIACLDSLATRASSLTRRPSCSKSGTSTEPNEPRISGYPAAAKRARSMPLTYAEAFARRKPDVIGRHLDWYGTRTI
jgi:hypothetical protein